MSRSYQIRVSESETRTVHVEDGIETHLDLLPVLPVDRMGELLAARLEEQGFERDGSTMTRKDKDGLEITVDLKTSTVSVKLSSDKEVEEKVELTGHGYEEDGDSTRADRKKELKDKAVKQIEAKITETTEKLRKEVTQKLEKKLDSLKKGLDDAVNAATLDALTEKAKSLGQVKEVSGDAAGNVTIRVQLS
jgi:hypothetical protein